MKRRRKSSPIGLDNRTMSRVEVNRPWCKATGIVDSGKLYFHRDLCWVAKRTGKFPQKYMQLANITCISLTNRRHSTCVDLCWVAKRWKTCVHVRANLISTKESASHCKSTQGLAKRSRKETQVFNLRLLASPTLYDWENYFIMTGRVRPVDRSFLICTALQSNARGFVIFPVI